MPHQIKFHATQDPEKLLELYTLCGTEWSGVLTADEFGKVELEKHLESNKNGELIEGFYLEDVESGKIIATSTVKRVKAFYKEADRSSAISSIPDPSLIGVKNVKGLILGYVFTDKNYRHKGFGDSIVKKAISFTEEEIIKEHLDKADKSKNDSFDKMVLTDGVLDQQLANYYLSKQYFWVLNSSIGKYYEKFGFKSYPLDFYKIPTSVLSREDEILVNSLINSSAVTANPNHVGKKLKVLRGSSKQDRDLITFILQGKELEILTELNKLIFHSELSGNHKSSSSLTNVTNVLSMSKLGSSNELASITELSSKPDGSIAQDTRRKSSIHHMTVPKFSLKPSETSLSGIYQNEEASAKKALNKQKAIDFTDIKGAIFTNELQQKNYYILWTSFPSNSLFVIGMGELKFDLIGAFSNPESAAIGDVSLLSRRRGSSFTGLNELGGFNFQDLNVLLHTAVVVGSDRQLSNLSAIYVSVNNLPSNIPTPMLHDYFLNYLPQTFENVYSHDDSNAPDHQKIEFVNDAAESLKILPMLRKFGSNKHEFDLDWYSHGI